MYKLCYYRFDEVTTQQGKPTGWDTVRQAEIGVIYNVDNTFLAQRIQVKALQRSLHQREMDREDLRGDAPCQHGPQEGTQVFHHRKSAQHQQAKGYQACQLTV